MNLPFPISLLISIFGPLILWELPLVRLPTATTRTMNIAIFMVLLGTVGLTIDHLHQGCRSGLATRSCFQAFSTTFTVSGALLGVINQQQVCEVVVKPSSMDVFKTIVELALAGRREGVL